MKTVNRVSDYSLAHNGKLQSKVLLMPSIQTEHHPDQLNQSQESLPSVQEEESKPTTKMQDITPIFQGETLSVDNSPTITQNLTRDNFEAQNTDLATTQQLSAAASAAAQELIQNFLQNPN